MSRLRRILAIVSLALGAFFTCTASVALDNQTYPSYNIVKTVNTQSVIPVPDKAAETPTEEEPKDESLGEGASLNILIGTISGSIIGIISAVGAVIRALRKYKELQIADYEQTAKDAEAKRLVAIDRQHEAEAERDKLSQEYETSRSDFLVAKDKNFEKARKELREHNERLAEIHREYSDKLEETWNKLLITTHKLRETEMKLMEMGVKVEITPPPFTEEMLEDVTVKDKVDASQPLTSEFPVIDHEDVGDHDENHTEDDA